MSVITVRVMLTEDAHWSVQSDDSAKRITYASRSAAIAAAGVHRAMENDGVLLIHGMDSQESELDFRDCDVVQLAG